MATATMPVSALAPYQPPDGLAPRDVIAHAREHIDRLQKKHASLRESLQHVKVGAQRGVNTITQTVFAVGTSSALGFVNGRYGGEKGYVAPYSVPVDFTLGAVSHIAGLATSLLLEDERDAAAAAQPGAMPRLSDILHTVGDAGLGCGTYRFFHQKGAEHAAEAGAAKGQSAPSPSPPGPGANAGRGGAVYNVPPPQR
jgi:hypothetical protein